MYILVNECGVKSKFSDYRPTRTIRIRLFVFGLIEPEICFGNLLDEKFLNL